MIAQSVQSFIVHHADCAIALQAVFGIRIMVYLYRQRNTPGNQYVFISYTYVFVWNT